ncbi:MAG: autotransporter outer membrane beta-barrel domain-containing protein [Hyphomicrobiales bacterium]|nr:autotransporter outer membrane beta-barrel domain-containing protein [Hyphomicrobiales bacterium]
MVNGAAGDRLTLTGTYAGTAGSAINVDVNTATRTADLLTINGAATGASRINVNLLPGAAFAFATPVDVVVAGAGSSLDASSSVGRIGGNGFFNYFLRQNPASPGNFQVVSQFNSGAVSGAASGVAGVINSLQAGFHQPSSAIISRPDNCQPNQLMGGPFIRLNTGETTLRSNSIGSGGGTAFSASSRTDARFSGGQGGVDLGICNVNNSGWNLHAGVMGGYVNSKASGISATPNPGGSTLPALRTRTKVDMDVPFFGGYVFVTSGPFTAEFNVRRDDYKSKVTTLDLDSGAGVVVGPNTRLKGDGLSYNASMSYRIAYGDAAYIEPAIGLSKGTTRFDNLGLATGPAGDFVAFSRTDSLLGRIGFNAGYAMQMTDNLVVVPFINMSLWHEFANPTKARAVFPGESLTFDVATNRVGTFGQAGLGVQFRLLNTPLLGFIRGDVRVGDRIDGKALNVGVRLQF